MNKFITFIKKYGYIFTIVMIVLYFDSPELRNRTTDILMITTLVIVLINKALDFFIQKLKSR